ncbi:MAG TPA: gliding motility-associated C-terminal domain-containing protein [Saprospiraceae bacterium]|nr:gliding motility-associated C-terminal domain-containing protein [Saprospiraceae bacterium]HMQ84365.1 gliding motility-associated C-terminal domain-containing protein [Saprospiraceae bacterium]
MRILLLSVSFVLIFCGLIVAQPVNDDCAGLIDLGVVPFCTDDIYTNVDATASNIGFGNIPSCFNGGSVQNDVWFSFTTNDTLIDVTVTLIGTNDGANGTITNPQIAVYRGECSFNNLADLGYCVSAPTGTTQTQLDILGLTPNTTYFIRVNDYSATGTPNWGDFLLCVEEYVPAINIGSSPSSTSCFGTLYDSGGPDGDYGNNQNLTFTITPSQFNQCIQITLVDLQMEQGFEELNFYAGANTNAPLIASLTGFLTGEPFNIQTDASSITVQFISDGSVTFPGFELTWECSPVECSGVSFDNPTVINGLPYNEDDISTCEGAATFATSPCGTVPFLNGPEYIFAYNSPGGICATIELTGESFGTGILVLDGLPNDPETICIGQSNNGTLAGVDFQTAGLYYIIVANGNGCTDFDISMDVADCNLNPSLSGALCNPLNGCIELDGLPSVFNFNQGFQDVAYNQGVNSGCWLGVGAVQPNFYWFSIEAQADGPFGFIVQADNPAEASDIDFNVWGPFTTEQVCEMPASVINYVENNMPVRSSWAGGADPTGLASIHPILGTPVTDPYDCEGGAGAFGDDFCSVIDCQEGEIYVVLINDWGNGIESGAIQVDWSPSAPEVLAPIPPLVVSGDTSVCAGEAVQLLVESSVENIIWLKDTTTLSCLNCLDPIATPEETTLYVGVVNAVCYSDTVQILVEVFDLDAGPDATVCVGETYEILAGDDYATAVYEWVVPNGLSLSCTDCPNPTVTALVPGTYDLAVSLSADACFLSDVIQITVLDAPAPVFEIAEDTDICDGETVNIGGSAVPGQTYSWASNPGGFGSDEPNPVVGPSVTTTYILSVTNGICPVSSVDSVTVTVFIPPTLSISGDTAVCQEEPIILGSTLIEEGVQYTWSGPATIENPNDPNSIAFPEQEGTYTLTAVRGACTEVESFEVSITPISIDVLAADTVTICRGETLTFNTEVVPVDSIPIWTSTQPGFGMVEGNTIVVAPQTLTTYYTTVRVGSQCVKLDSVVVVVDSLPFNLAIMPADTSVCEGSPVVLSSTTYEPSDFPNIEFQWLEEPGFQSPDTLYNMVINAVDTINYRRVTINGVCVDTASALVVIDKTPEISLSPLDTTVCAGEPVQILATVSEDTDEVEWTGEGLSCTDCLNPIATPFVTTVYSVEATNEECPANASLTINVVPAPDISMNTQTVICLGDAIRLNFANTPGVTYTWTSSDPNFVPSNDPLLVVSPTDNTTYFLHAENGFCDPIDEQITIEVVGPVVLDVNAIPDFICEGDQVTLTAVALGGSSQDIFEWVGSDGFVGSGDTVTVFPNQDTEYTLTYIDGAMCDTLTETVFVETEPGVFITGIDLSKDSLYLGDEFTLTAVYNTEVDGDLTFSWFQSDSLLATGTNLDVLDMIANKEGELTFKVVVETPTGCTYEFSIKINVLETKVDMPNAFTPNGDGTNDFFNYVTNREDRSKIEVVQFRIFNRWGQLVYDNENPTAGWDGQFKNNDQPSDVYVYVIKIVIADLKALPEMQGELTLLR